MRKSRLAPASPFALVNGQKVLEQLLASGDVIELGAPGWKLTFLAPES